MPVRGREQVHGVPEKEEQMAGQRPGGVLDAIRRPTWVVLGAVALVAAACSPSGTASPGASSPASASASPASLPASASPSAAGSPETTTIRLGLLPLADVAPVHLAIENGMFEAEGLTVEITLVQGGAAAIPALVAGDLDITFGNYVSFFLASSQGIDLRIVAEQNRATPGFSRIMTLPDSGTADAAGLVGKRLAVNTLANVAEITSRAQIKDAGADPDAVEYIEIPFPDMIATLERGDVDAIFAVEPFATLATQQLQAVEISNPYGGRLEGFPVAGFQSTTEFATQNPNTIAAFQRAMIAASEEAASNPAAVVEILPTYTTLTPELAAELKQPLYVSQIDAAELQRVVDLMVEFELLDDAPDINALVVATP
jgi:NitT/TauT family transport system substrate-binding protein